MQRTMSWIAMFNSAILLFLFLSKLQDYGFEIHITAWYIPIFLGIIVLMILFGYIEDRAGFYREESRESNKRNPQMKEILERLERIENRLKKR